MLSAYGASVTSFAVVVAVPAFERAVDLLSIAVVVVAGNVYLTCCSFSPHNNSHTHTDTDIHTHVVIH